MTALAGRASRFLLADEVGLGKTIEAGLLIRELMLRGWAERSLILTPPGLVDQWHDELATRFAIDATIMAADSQQRRRSALPPGANPWALPAVYLTSLDFAKRLEVRRSLEQVPWDIVLIDEAHGASSSSDRGLAARALAARARYLVLVTATPHSGDPAAYRWLTDLGRLGDETTDPIAIFRRCRLDVGLPARRPAKMLHVRPSRAERRIHRVLADYTHAVWARRTRTPAALLAMIVLNKRALSGAGALHRSVVRRMALLGSETGDSHQEDLPLVDADPATAGDEEPGRALAAPGLSDAASERAWLAALRDLSRASARHESKRRCLHRLLRRSREPVVVFTEYRDTLEDLAAALGTEHEVAVLHGGLSAPERRSAEARFRLGEARVLLATDVASEGLNLQARCRWVVNYELPWNPVRLEQRVGRVERLGQTRGVNALHLVAAQTAEASVLARLAARLDRASAAGLNADHILGRLDRDRLEEALLTSDPTKIAAFLRADPRRPTGAGTRRRRPEPVAPLTTSTDSDRHAAGREATRLAERRRLHGSGAVPPGFVSAKRTRCWLTTLPGWHGAGVVIVGRVLVEDVGNLPLGHLWMAWLVETGFTSRAGHASSRLRSTLGTIGPALGVDATRRAAESAIDRQAHAAFVRRALVRERRILGDLRRAMAGPVQPGLFDRRALRAVANERRLLMALVGASEGRLDRLERALSGPLRLDCTPTLLGIGSLPHGGAGVHGDRWNAVRP